MADYKKAKPGSPEDALLQDVVKRYHPDLDSHGVTVALEFAGISNDAKAKGKHAVMLHGYPCIAVVRRTNERERRYGSPDAIITYDAELWDQHTADEREAVLDHECQHLEIVKDESGLAKLDNQMRPRLKLRPHDVQIGWFRAVAERHGRHSAEVQQAKSLVREPRNAQAFFRFMTNPKAVDALIEAIHTPLAAPGSIEEAEAEPIAVTV